MMLHHIKFGSRFLIIFFVVMMVVLYFYSSTKTTVKHRNLRFEKYKLSAYPTVTSKYLTSSNTTITSLSKSPNVHESKIFRFGHDRSEIKIAVVLCGERLNQTIVTLKSAIILTSLPLHYIIITDKQNREAITDQLLSWPQNILKSLSFEVHPITFPNGSNGEEWRKLFKLCACQRLFLPSLLQHIDSLIYVDTDVIFMNPVDQLWHYFSAMNASQIAGLAPEHEDFATGWYNRFARHPYYEPLGVNSGVMLMNLTRMRSFKWETYLQPVMEEYKLKIVWGDQDIINIIFHFHSEKLFIFPCDWNFRPDHCMYSSVCKAAEESGVKVIHGNRGVYQNNKQPVFKAIYEAMANYEMGTNLMSNLLGPMKRLMKEATSTNCGKISTILTKSLDDVISNRNTLLT